MVNPRTALEDGLPEREGVSFITAASTVGCISVLLLPFAISITVLAHSLPSEFDISANLPSTPQPMLNLAFVEPPEPCPANYSVAPHFSLPTYMHTACVCPASSSMTSSLVACREDQASRGCHTISVPTHVDVWAHNFSYRICQQLGGTPAISRIVRGGGLPDIVRLRPMFDPTDASSSCPEGWKKCGHGLCFDVSQPCPLVEASPGRYRRGNGFDKKGSRFVTTLALAGPEYELDKETYIRWGHPFPGHLPHEFLTGNNCPALVAPHFVSIHNLTCHAEDDTCNILQGPRNFCNAMSRIWRSRVTSQFPRYVVKSLHERYQDEMADLARALGRGLGRRVSGGTVVNGSRGLDLLGRSMPESDLFVSPDVSLVSAYLVVPLQLVVALSIFAAYISGGGPLSGCVPSSMKSLFRRFRWALSWVTVLTALSVTFYGWLITETKTAYDLPYCHLYGGSAHKKAAKVFALSIVYVVLHAIQMCILLGSFLCLNWHSPIMRELYNQEVEASRKDRVAAAVAKIPPEERELYRAALSVNPTGPQGSKDPKDTRGEERKAVPVPPPCPV